MVLREQRKAQSNKQEITPKTPDGALPETAGMETQKPIESKSIAYAYKPQCC
jgi:hypothetical protein